MSSSDPVLPTTFSFKLGLAVTSTVSIKLSLNLSRAGATGPQCSISRPIPSTTKRTVTKKISLQLHLKEANGKKCWEKETENVTVETIKSTAVSS